MPLVEKCNAIGGQVVISKLLVKCITTSILSAFQRIGDFLSFVLFDNELQ